VVIRTVFSVKVSEIRKRIHSVIAETEEELNQMEDLKLNFVVNLKNGILVNQNNLDKVDVAINKLKNSLQSHRSNLSDKQAFKSRVKWFEYGKKSNKFFLSLMKSKQNQKLISKISNGNELFVGQEEVSKGITHFYRKLYEKDRNLGTFNDDEDFYKHCPKLTASQAKELDETLTIKDLFNALKSCKDSSPGPDGIPYVVYKTFWKITGPIILDSWKHSVVMKTLPKSHYESIITLLPKEGKDTSDIKNWRPITLSNCNSKIITKALSNKVLKVLDSILDVSQTAYVPGRSVADNLRSNFYMKNFFNNNKVDSVLISLDAKKAFDSVDHTYIENTLRAYGFGEGFVDIFKTLYKDITARILVNGFKSEVISIQRGVKQGDALSCAIFVICIDPLLRNINKSKGVKEIKVGKNNTKISFKAGAYADDVSVICENDRKSIWGVFNEYNRLTIRSGLELNAEKTEILRLNTNKLLKIQIKYLGKHFDVNTVNKLKICGLYFCNDNNEEHNLNVMEKIKQFSYKTKQWIPRHLTFEGKILIVKTFGLSQLIYNMQCYGFKDTEVINIEREIFKFIWSNNDKQNGIDRISRAVMKNEYKKGGLKVTDVECLDRSIKLKQFIRAGKSKHAIAKIQELESVTKEETNSLRQEYHIETVDETICLSAQTSLNIITDYNRQTYSKLDAHEYETEKNLINEVASINLKTYLRRKNKMFALCIMKPLSNLGIVTLGDLTQAYEHETDNNLNKAMALIINSFPKILVNIAKAFNEEINEINSESNYILIEGGKRMAVDMITAKDFQLTLKHALGRLEERDFDNKLDIEDFDTNNIELFRKHCKNTKLRNIYFRLIHNDFFTHSRMKRYKMTLTDQCPRCEQTETTKHLLWECKHVVNIWKIYNDYMNRIGFQDSTIRQYKDIFKVGINAGTTMIKIKLIQELIQIRRPINWDTNQYDTMVEDMVKLEFYNSKKNHTEHKFNTKWGLFNK
jgi:hypothetical protein